MGLLTCHNASSCFCKAPPGTPPGTSYAFDEGDVQTAPGLYQIPLWVTLPKKEEVSNLLVVAAPSATHIGMSTLRMEPQFMMVGHAAGTLYGYFIIVNIIYYNGLPTSSPTTPSPPTGPPHCTSKKKKLFHS